MGAGNLELKFVINGSNTSAIQALLGVSNAAKSTGGDLSKIDKAAGGFAETSKALDGLSDKLNKVRSGVIAVGTGAVGASGIADLVRLTDQYTSINSRLKLASESSADFAKAQAGVLEIAQRNGRELGATATLYSRIVGPLRDIGKTGADAMRITDGVAASLRIAGATAAESSSAQIQFAQAIAAGTLQGDELNAVLEASPPLAKALATAMRVAVGDLKKMGSEGKLTGKIIADALLTQVDDLKARAAQMEGTIGESLTRVRNAFQSILGSNTSASTVKIANAISAVANNMQTLLEVATVAGAGLAAVFGVRLLTSIGTTIAAKQTLISVEREAAAMALANARANLQAAEAEAARTSITKGLAVAQTQLALAERGAALAASGVAARAGAGLVGLMGGPIGAVTTALTLGITAWQLWGNRSEEATKKASKSLAELVKEMKEFGANMATAERVKQYEALAEAIKKARQEEAQLREAARQRAMGDMNVATKAQVEGAVDNDPKVAAKRAERVAAEKAMQDELAELNRSASDQRLFIAKAQVEKQKALNGELVTNEKEAMEKRLAVNVSAAAAVRGAWLKTLDEIKAKQAEAAAAPGKAADVSANLKTRTDNVKMSGMSESEKADFQAAKASEAREAALADQVRGRFELMKGYSQQLKGDFSEAKKSFDAAEKDLNRAFAEAEKAGDAGIMGDISQQLVEIEKQKGKIAEAEAKKLGEQAEAQRGKMNELEEKANSLKNALAGMDVQIKIDTAMASLNALEEKAKSVKAALAQTQAGAPAPGAQSPAAAPASPEVGRAFGGVLPGFAPHDRSDNMIYRGTPGEWVIQRPAVRYWGPEFISAINSMRLPKFAFGGQLGKSTVPKFSMPSLNQEAIKLGAPESTTPLHLDFGGMNKFQATAAPNVAEELTKFLKLEALRKGSPR